MLSRLSVTDFSFSCFIVLSIPEALFSHTRIYSLTTDTKDFTDSHFQPRSRQKASVPLFVLHQDRNNFLTRSPKMDIHINSSSYKTQAMAGVRQQASGLFTVQHYSHTYSNGTCSSQLLFRSSSCSPQATWLSHLRYLWCN